MGRIIRFLGALAAVITLVGCGKPQPLAEKYGSAGDIAVCVVDMRAAFVNAGCAITDSGVVMSPEVMTAVSRAYQGEARNHAREALRLPGIDLTEVVGALNPQGELLLAARITNGEAVRQWLQGLCPVGASDSAGCSIYQVDRRCSLVVSDDDLVMVRSPRALDDALAVLQTFKDSARQAPMQAWQLEGVRTKGQLANMLVDVPALDGLYRLTTGRPLLPETVEGYNRDDISDCYALVNVALQGNAVTGRLAFVKDGLIVESQDPGLSAGTDAVGVVSSLPYCQDVEMGVSEGAQTITVTFAQSFLVVLLSL